MKILETMKRYFFIVTLLIAITMNYSCNNESAPKTDAQKEWQQIEPKAIQDNAVKLFADDWTIITAGTPDKFNMMTASWGTIGHLWQKPIAMCFVRPQRYTFGFTEENDTFTLTFFDEEYRDNLQYAGSVSGRDEDKVKGFGLTTKVLPSGNISYEEARLIIECKKIYTDFFKEDSFLDTVMMNNIYSDKDFHRIYIGEITSVWEKK